MQPNVLSPCLEQAMPGNTQLRQFRKIPLPVDMAPVDASIVGIVDTINTEKSNKNKP